MAVFTKACVGEAEALRYSFGYLIAALYSGPLKGALAAFGCGLWWLIWILCAGRFLLCEEIRGERCFLLGTSLYSRSPFWSRQTPVPKGTLWCAEFTGWRAKFYRFHWTDKPSVFNKSSGLVCALCSCCVSCQLWSLSGVVSPVLSSVSSAAKGRPLQGFSCMLRCLFPPSLEWKLGLWRKQEEKTGRYCNAPT